MSNEISNERDYFKFVRAYTDFVKELVKDGTELSEAISEEADRACTYYYHQRCIIMYSDNIEHVDEVGLNVDDSGVWSAIGQISYWAIYADISDRIENDKVIDEI